MSKCQTWCTDHRHEMVGPSRAGECHTEYFAYADDIGTTVAGDVQLYDGEAEPQAFIVVSTPEGERFVYISLDALSGIASAIQLYPEQFSELIQRMSAAEQGVAV